MRHPTVLGETEIIAFLTHLANQQRVSRALPGELEGTRRLIALLLYGAGLRLLECLTLRVNDLDVAGGEIRLRRGKGGARCMRKIWPAGLVEWRCNRTRPEGAVVGH